MASGNLWAIFKSITEQSAMQIATVLARNGAVYDVQSMDGNISQASYSGGSVFEVGSKVFIQNGKITGQAPELPYLEIEV